jgi:hypothetical protein
MVCTNARQPWCIIRVSDTLALPILPANRCHAYHCHDSWHSSGVWECRHNFNEEVALAATGKRMDSDTANNWPIELSRLLKDPDPDKIELAAEWHLSRALTIGNVIAFVGSGVPMAYGQITWKALVETLARNVTQKVKEIDKTNKKPRGGSDSSKDEYQELVRLSNQIDLMQRAEALQGQYPTLFQLTELLNKRLHTPADSTSNVTDKSTHHNRLRRQMASLIFDDRGQASELIKRVFLSQSTQTRADPGDGTPKDGLEKTFEAHPGFRGGEMAWKP